ncbi:putative ferric-chelate reductase 1 homolog isoform X2 [Chrysoperla carnea]|uniref:putative ferric-chelate reductase 1 homolog isoform X2 n=1 Tax=Chrysoperla carnea TaxID=189513 RepID=UPI001D09274C|nr:putative ferric-chelate reductase 1 homolog isoform X2 [Chrysoperla carnea]
MLTTSWILVITIICYTTITVVYSLPQGAPTSVCQTMLPAHNSIPPQSDVSPYLVSLPVQKLSENARMQVTIVSSQGLHIAGYMLQGRRQDNGEPIGKFTEVSPELGKQINCSKEKDTVTHVNTNKKSAVVVEWEAPEGYLGPVIFNSTIAQDYATFWTGVESNPVEIVKRSAGYTPGISTTRAPVSPTTTPFNFEPEPATELRTSQDPFYNGCGDSKTCFGAPANCVEQRNCKAAVACTVKGEQYEFELKSVQGAYVAVGLSDDDKMGDDSTIECVRDATGLDAHMGYTVPRPNLNAFRLPNSKYGITIKNVSAVDGGIYCRVVRDAKTTVQGKSYDLINDQFYIMIAAGDKVHPTKVSFHSVAYAVSAERKSLADVSGFTAASKLLLRLHGAFMVAAWIGTASIGILLARYFRQTWVNSQLCGKDHWFAWHRMLMILTWLLTVAGYVIIFVELQAWSSERNPHAILGTATTVLCFLQPIAAFFRPHPGSSKRPWFNWLHWLGGNVAHILAIVTIFFAVKLNKAELPEWMDWVLVGFVAFHVIMHLILSILGCVSDRPSGHRVSAFPMKEMGQRGNSAMLERKMDAPHSCLRKFLLAVYIIGIALIVTALILIVVLAPIEETFESMQKSLNMT